MNNLLKTYIAILGVLSIFLTTSAARAATEYDRIKPWLEDETVGILSINPDSIDTQAVADELMFYVAEYLDQADADQVIAKINSFKIVADGYLAQFKNDGIESINFVVNMYDLPSFYMVVPHEPGKECPSLKALIQMLNLTELKNIPFISLDTMEDVDNTLLIGRAGTIERVVSKSSSSGNNVSSAVKTVEDFGIKVLFTPSESLKRVIEETLYPIKEENEIITGADLTRSVQWAALGLNLNEKLSLGYTAQSQSSEAAKRAMALVELLQKNALKEEPWIKEKYPEINSMLKNVKPKLSGSQLKGSINNIQIREALAPIMLECFNSARLQANIQISMQNAKGVATGLVLYANEHNNMMPKTLDELIEAVDLPTQILVSPLENIGTGYIFRGKDLRFDQKSPAGLILIYERFEKNCDQYYIAGFMDGHSEYLTKEAFKQVLQNDNELRRLNKIEEKPEE